MGYVLPPAPPPRVNIDRHGMPRDYATYVWLLYGKRVHDDSVARRVFDYRTDRADPFKCETR